MLANAIRWLQFRSHRKGSLEINTLVIWIILLVFLALVLIIILAVKNRGDGVFGGFCELMGC